MLNTPPNKKGKYRQGLYIPQNKSKLIQINKKGGLYFRSSMEQKIMIYLDKNPNVIRWNSEIINIPYVKKTWDNKIQENVMSTHKYSPDFYYELKEEDGGIIYIVAEVKPFAETQPPMLAPKATATALKNYEYALREYNKNLEKWTACIEWCKTKGFKFIIITEKTFKKYIK